MCGMATSHCVVNSVVARVDLYASRVVVQRRCILVGQAGAVVVPESGAVPVSRQNQVVAHVGRAQAVSVDDRTSGVHVEQVHDRLINLQVDALVNLRAIRDALRPKQRLVCLACRFRNELGSISEVTHDSLSLLTPCDARNASIGDADKPWSQNFLLDSLHVANAVLFAVQVVSALQDYLKVNGRSDVFGLYFVSPVDIIRPTDNVLPHAFSTLTPPFSVSVIILLG